MFFTLNLVLSINIVRNDMDQRYWIPLLPWRQMNKPESKSAQIKLAQQPTITREDGWNDLELRLVNRYRKTVWVEEASVVLVDLDAIMQTVVPTGQARQPILQNIEPNEILSVSLGRTIYDAAGRPHGPYSCLVLTNVRFRVFSEWCNTWGRQRLRVRREHCDFLCGRS